MSKIKILVVDDKTENRYLLEKLLQGNGYETISAANGAEALDLAIKNPPDMIVTDILMPIMDGFMLCREWKKSESLNKIPFVFYTATYTDSKDEEFAMSLGANRFIVKPEEPDRFLEILKEVLAEFKAGTIEPCPAIDIDDKAFTKGHSETLVRKLEDKVIQAKIAETKAKQYAAELEKILEERKIMEKELLYKTTLLEAQYENTIDGILVVNSEGKILLSNNRLREIWNIPQPLLDAKIDAPVLQHVLTQLKDPDEFLKKVEYLYSHQTEKSRDEIEFANGKVLDRYSAPLIDTADTYYGRVWYFRDITDRKESEKKIKDSFEKLRRTLEETVNSLSSALETRDPYTAGHQRRDAQLACKIAKEMGLSDDQIEGLRIASLLHDIGKMAVPAEILSKPTKLTAIEYGLIKVHPEVGYNILKDVEFPWPIAQIVYQHQERLDGSGYPRGLKGDEILLEARILAVADVVEAMSSHRPYRPALGLIQALDEINKNKGIFYDSQAVDACLRVFQEKGFKFQ
jgi:putative nucleotidyltransferase with HDIG domain